MIFDREDEQIIDNALTPAGTFDFNALLCFVSEIASSISPKILSLILTPIKGILDDYSTRKRVKDMKHVLQIIVNEIRRLDVSKLDEEYLATADYSMHMKKLIRITRDEERESKLIYLRNLTSSIFQTPFEIRGINDTIISLIDNINPSILAVLVDLVQAIRNANIETNPIMITYEREELLAIIHTPINPIETDEFSHNGPEPWEYDNMEFFLCILFAHGLIELDPNKGYGSPRGVKYRLTLLAFKIVDYISPMNNMETTTQK